MAYRISPSTAWTEGWTHNISKSGVLFSLANGPSAAPDERSDEPACEPGRELEFVIQLSRGALQGPGVPMLPDLHCHGRIVRRAVAADGLPLVAASIQRQVVHGGEQHPH